MDDLAGGLTVVIADDHAVLRDGLRLILEQEADIDVVGEAGDVDAALRLVRDHRPDVLVLDLNMPGEPSLPAIPEVVDLAGTRVLVLTMQSDPAYAREALRTGAAGYVLKEAAGRELVEAVRTVARGETYVTPKLGARLAEAPPPPVGYPDDLSEREVDVLRLLALGHTNTEIAAQLYLSVRTVESHRARIQQKTRRSTRAALVSYAMEHGLI